MIRGTVASRLCDPSGVNCAFEDSGGIAALNPRLLSANPPGSRKEVAALNPRLLSANPPGSRKEVAALNPRYYLRTLRGQEKRSLRSTPATICDPSGVRNSSAWAGFLRQLFGLRYFAFVARGHVRSFP
jgi:hypothetical protein